MAKKQMLSRQTAQQYEKELLDLKLVDRPAVVLRIKDARAQGDLSENAEYSAAKEEQGRIEGRIAFLEDLLKNAEIYSEEEADTSVVSYGSTVKVFDEMFEEEVIYKIVGSEESDPLSDLISGDSPVGRALLGAKVGDQVHFDTPGGTCTLKVLEITH
ncbi:MAG: transcription elongation factor GreA [Firmicutes bacterium]|nr:transcription elongation factor GreA [Bacillota bacterium]